MHDWKSPVEPEWFDGWLITFNGGGGGVLPYCTKEGMSSSFPSLRVENLFRIILVTKILVPDS